MKNEQKLTMNIQSSEMFLAEMGRVKIGKKGPEKPSKQDPSKMVQSPIKFDFFLITSLQKDSDHNFIPDKSVMDLMPKDADGKCRRIPIAFLFDDIDLNIQSSYMSYMGRTLQCCGNGVVANRYELRDGKRVSVQSIECPCPKKDFEYQGKDKCRKCSKLSFIIRGIKKFGGVYRFITAGKNSTDYLLNQLKFFKAATCGPIAGIPFDLVVNPKTAMDPNGTSQIVYVVSLEYAGDFEMIREDAQRIITSSARYGAQMTRIEEEARKMIESSHSPFAEDLGEDPDDAEFHPESQDGYTKDQAEQPSAAEPKEPAKDPVEEAIKAAQSEKAIKTTEPAKAEVPITTAAQVELVPKAELPKPMSKQASREVQTTHHTTSNAPANDAPQKKGLPF